VYVCVLFAFGTTFCISLSHVYAVSVKGFIARLLAAQ